MPKGLRHFSVKIQGLHSYLPINYVVVGESEIYSSLVEGDFVRLLHRLRLLEDNTLSAIEIAVLFMLLEYPNRELRIVETLEELALQVTDKDRETLAQVVQPAVCRRVDGGLECEFICSNVRTSALERFRLQISPEYELSGESEEVLYFGRH